MIGQLCLHSMQGRLNNIILLIKLLQFAQLHQFIFPKVVQQSPLEKGKTVFTDGFSNGIASLVIENESYYCQTSYSSAQEVELSAVLQALQSVPQSFNL